MTDDQREVRWRFRVLQDADNADERLRRGASALSQKTPRRPPAGWSKPP